MKLKELIEKLNVLVKPGAKYKIIVTYSSDDLSKYNPDPKLQWAVHLYLDENRKHYKYFGNFSSAEELLQDICETEEYQLSNLTKIEID